MTEQPESDDRVTVVIEDGRVVQEVVDGRVRLTLNWRQKLQLAAMAVVAVAVLIFVILPLFTLSLAVIGVLMLVGFLVVLYHRVTGKPLGLGPVGVIFRRR